MSGVKRVSLVYRRTKRYMPADSEEIGFAQSDGVEFCELLAPVSLGDGALVCEQMELGAPDVSGRRSPVSTGRMVTIAADTVITAVGDHVDTALLERFGIAVDGRGKAMVNSDTLETGLPGVYIVGDAARGPATVAEAIADAIRAAEAITGRCVSEPSPLNVSSDAEAVCAKKGVLYKGCDSDSAPACESARCLECATICENCVDVCPNRANVSVMSEGRPQIVHIDYMCNECGNCEAFCPYSSAPYMDKFTFFACTEDFENSENQGFMLLDDAAVRVRIDGAAADYTDGTGLPEGIWELIQAVLRKGYMVASQA